MNVLGIDFGTKKIGVAVMELTTQVTSPLPIIKNTNKVYSDIKELADSYKVTDIVIGYPSYEKTRSNIDKFTAMLSEVIPKVTIHFSDEDNTSIAIKSGLTSKKQKKNLDSMSAIEILKQWYTDNLEN